MPCYSVCLMQLQKEAQEKEETYQRMVNAERRVGELEDENKQLKRELDKLRKEVCMHRVSSSIHQCQAVKYTLLNCARES